MDLLVEIGNTRLKWAWRFEGGRTPQKAVVHDGRLPVEARREWSAEGSPARVLVANVAGPEMEDTLHRWVLETWRLEPRFLLSRAEQMGVVSAYQEPQTLGIDRWLALIAAHRAYPETLLIVDAGSAVTLDVLDAEGGHRGGFILPGLKMAHRALMANAALPSTSLMEATDELGTDTLSAISNGMTHGVVALIEKMVASLAKEGEMKTVMTGGDASRLLSLLSCPIRLHPELVMEGLALVAEQTP
ncbi:MAG TPA: type III pantothenate kinase [Chromatiales bacterium]|nr:type III pantothenate kinase [Chromatiales bacterium]